MVTVQYVKMAANTQTDVARLSASFSAHASTNLNAYPSSSVGTRLDDSSLQIAMKLRLGARICKPHIFICGDPVDSSGTRGFSCRMSAARLSRHAAVTTSSRNYCHLPDFHRGWNHSSLNRSDGKRPDGLSMIPWKDGRCMI